MMLYNYLKSAKKCGCKTILHIREHWPLDEHTIQLQWARKYVYKYADEIIAINKYSASVFPDKKSTIVYDWIDFSDRYEPISMNDFIYVKTQTIQYFFQHTHKSFHRFLNIIP